MAGQAGSRVSRVIQRDASAEEEVLSAEAMRTAREHFLSFERDPLNFQFPSAPRAAART